MLELNTFFLKNVEKSNYRRNRKLKMLFTQLSIQINFYQTNSGNFFKNRSVRAILMEEKLAHFSLPASRFYV